MLNLVGVTHKWMMNHFHAAKISAQCTVWPALLYRLGDPFLKNSKEFVALSLPAAGRE